MGDAESILRILSLYKAVDIDAFIVGECLKIGNNWNIWVNTNVDKAKQILEYGGIRGLTSIEDGHNVRISIIDESDTGIYELTKCTIHTVEREDFLQLLEEHLNSKVFTFSGVAYNGDRYIYGSRECLEDFKSDRLRINDNVIDRELTGEEVAKALEILANAPLEVCENTKQILKVSSGKLLELEPEKVGKCLARILTSEFRVDVLDEYSSLIFKMVPYMEMTYGLGQYNDGHKYDVYKHTIETLRHLEEYNDTTLILAALLHDIGKPQTLCYDVNGEWRFYGHESVGALIARDVLERIGVGNEDITDICQIIQYHGCDLSDGDNIRRVANELGNKQFKRLTRLSVANVLAKSDCAIEKYRSNVKNNRDVYRELIGSGIKLNELEVCGNDLIAIGFEPGQLIGDTLNKILKLVSEGRILNDKEVLTEYAKLNLEEV